jgi:hypothetical protein
MNLSDLSRSLERDGYAPLPSSRITWSFVAEGRVGVLRVGLPLETSLFSTERRSDGQRLALRNLHVGLFAGVDFLRSQRAASMLTGTLSGGDLFIDNRPGWSRFADRLAGLGKVDGLVSGYSLFSLELGQDVFFPLRPAGRGGPEAFALQLGGRFGYSWQLNRGGHWRTAEHNDKLGDGPRFDLGGPRFGLVFGWLLD